MLLLILLDLPQVDSVALGDRFVYGRLLRSQKVPVARLVLFHDELLSRVDAGVLAYPSFHRLNQALSETTLVHNVEIFLPYRDVGATPCSEPGQVFDHNTLVDSLLDLLLISESTVGTLQLRPQIVNLLSYLVTSLSIEGSLSKVCLCCHLLWRMQQAY